MTRNLEHVDVADEVRLDIGARVLDRIAYAGLRAEVDDAIEFASLERTPNRLVVREVDPFELETPGTAHSQLREAVFLQSRIVTVVDAVDADDVVAASQQPARNTKADEAGSSGN
jgi:hypothetical protein